MARVDGEIVHVAGFTVDVVDTTGAGDVFHGGFIYGLLQNWEVTEILRLPMPWPPSSAVTSAAGALSRLSMKPTVFQIHV